MASINTAGPGDLVNGESEDLLVFGYESKLYRDDDKADWIESGRHLIPWMGDNSILIDRYDVRGLLTDLRLDANLSTLPSTEPHIIDFGFDDRPTSMEEVERLCEEERYLAMNDEGDEELAFHEMEFKRLQSAVSGMGQDAGNYSSVGFNYDDAGASMITISPETNAEIESLPNPSCSPRRRKSIHEVPFVPPPGLYIPPGMTVPTKMKVHAIIEKTAKFVAAHGAQMEIIVKTKQGHNKQFNFLYYEDPLNEYYKNLLLAIKENLYKPSEDNSTQDEGDSSDSNSEGSASGGEEEDENGSGYLHPSLMKGREETAIPANFNLSFRPAALSNSAYSMLASRIKEVTGVPSPQDALDQPPPPPNPYPGDSAFSSNSGISYDPSVCGNQNNGYQGGVRFGDPAQQVPRTNPPPERSKPNCEEQTIIEKMASYVTKNGPAFEAVASTKGDPRFLFLDPCHKHHWYYLNCKKRFSVEASAVVASGGPVGYKPPESTIKTTQETTPPTTSATTVAASLKANHANALSRMATLPPALINKLEELRKKTQQNKLLRETQEKEALADKKPVIKFSSLLASVNLGGTVLASEANSPSQPSLVSYDPDEANDSASKTQNELDKPKSDSLLQQTSSEVSVPGQNLPQESIDRKEERRRKAALFLQRLKRPSTEEENTAAASTQTPTANASVQVNSEQAVNKSSAANTDTKSDDSDGLQGANGDTNEIAAPSSNLIVMISSGPDTPSGDNEEHKVHIESKRSGHRKHRRSRSRDRVVPRSKTKRRRSESSTSPPGVFSLTGLTPGPVYEPPKGHKSHKKHKRSSRIDDDRKSKKSPKKKKKRHKSSKSRSRKFKLHREK